VREPLMRAAATYFLTARTRTRAPVDPVARFHLGNGARLERINWLADPSPKGVAQSYGIMVNYLYDLDDIEKNHEAYAGSRTIVASGAVKKLARPARDLVPAEG
jgi:malonyl-CoA decarboxylase